MDIEVLKTLDNVEAYLRIAGWDGNFGQGLETLEHKHQKEMGVVESGDDDQEDEDGKIGKEEINDATQMHIEAMKSFFKGTPDEEEMFQGVLENISKMKESLDSEEDEEESRDNEIDKWDAAPDVYLVTGEEIGAWSDSHLERVKSFLDAWSGLRDKVWDAAFAHYRENYEDIWLLWGGEEADEIVLPKPIDRLVVEDLFRINTFHLYDDPNTFGISGNCTWDEEHGFGARFKNGDIESFGHADEAS